LVELIAIFNNAGKKYQKFCRKIKTASMWREQREQGSVAGSIAIDYSGQQMAMEV